MHTIRYTVTPKIAKKRCYPQNLRVTTLSQRKIQFLSNTHRYRHFANLAAQHQVRTAQSPSHHSQVKRRFLQTAGLLT